MAAAAALANDDELGYPDISFSVPVKAVWVRKWLRSSSEEEKRLSQGPFADTQLQTWGRGSLGSMKPYGYKGCPAKEGGEEWTLCNGCVGYMSG